MKKGHTGEGAPTLRLALWVRNKPNPSMGIGGHCLHSSSPTPSTSLHPSPTLSTTLNDQILHLCPQAYSRILPLPLSPAISPFQTLPTFPAVFPKLAANHSLGAPNQPWTPPSSWLQVINPLSSPLSPRAARNKLPTPPPAYAEQTTDQPWRAEAAPAHRSLRAG